MRQHRAQDMSGTRVCMALNLAASFITLINSYSCSWIH